MFFIEEAQIKLRSCCHVPHEATQTIIDLFMEQPKRTVLVVGNGGREHALTSKLLEDQAVGKVVVAPGNGGTRLLENQASSSPLPSHTLMNVDVPATDIERIVRLALQEQVDLVLVGPEAPLADGLADELNKAGIACFGPSKKAAQIEASKAFSKNFMVRHKIPTATHASFSDLQEALDYIENVPHRVVVKASGLASGKGVIIPATKEDAKNAVLEMLQEKKFGTAGEEIVIEQLLEGTEVSLLAFTDGHTIRVMPPAQDHKRLLDGDKGPNTGGMGVFCPSPLVSADLREELALLTIQKCVDAMRQEGFPFVGVLYAGLMLTKDGPFVLEYNCRFGDPETQTILPLLKTNLSDILLSCCEKKLTSQDVVWRYDKSSVTVIAASDGYPLAYEKGKKISGLDDVQEDKTAELYVFHAGTKLQDDCKTLATDGGRVLAVTAVADSLKEALPVAYKAINKINFEGIHFRTDIAHKYSQDDTRVAVLGSTRGTDLQALIDAISSGNLRATISMVISNRKDAYILERVRSYGIPNAYIPSINKSREQFEQEMIDCINQSGGTDLVLLIGFMRILSPLFVHAYEGRIYNVHPSLLPAFASEMDLDVHQAVLDSGCEYSGCTVHIVTEQVDAGPILVQKRCKVEPGETSDSLKAKVQKLEGLALIESIQMFQRAETQETYKSSGVDIEAGNTFVERIKPLVKSTSRPGCDAALGGFGGLFDLKQLSYEDPILVSGTDGVGTKLKVAHETNKHDSVGIDLVAMCANDVLCQGAEPIFFLDYFATSSLNVDQATEVVKGIALGCKYAGCALLGGETAEMPGMYQKGEYDIAGFCVGVVERSSILPKLEEISPGNVVLGLASSGIHSNGFSLVRKILDKLGMDLLAEPPFDSPHPRLCDVLLEPTKIYVQVVLPLMREGKVLAAAHITGGGLIENLPRILPKDFGIELWMGSWPVPPVFQWLQNSGNVKGSEMLQVFNMGIGMAFILTTESRPEVEKALKDSGEECYLIGHVTDAHEAGTSQVTVTEKVK